jgi:transposase
MGKVQKHESRNLRQNRYFSEDFKREKVKEIERNISSIAEIKREYEVSGTAIYKWIYKYSTMRKKAVRQVVEAESDTRKISQLKEMVRELERIVGQKQILLDFKEKMIELAEEEYGVDIKKKFGTKPFTGSGTGEKNTPTK